MIKNKKNIAFIFARGGSKGVPKKNLRLFNGKPLIAWTIQQAVKSDVFEFIVVSTDDEDIANIAKDYGAMVPFMRPKNLASDDSREWLSWQHGIEEIDKGLDYNFVSLPCVCPLRNVEDIKNTISCYEKGSFDMIFTIAKSDRSPYVNMIELNDSNEVFLSKSVDTTKIYRRQDSPNVFNIIPSVYVTSPKYILENTSMWDGIISGYEIPNERAIDIDTEIDFKVAEFLCKDMSINETET